jgi:hypothetical protein
MIKTRNFHPDFDIKLKCTCGHNLCDKRSVKQYVLDNVQTIREQANRPLTINSGGRCPYHPDEINRTTPADHQKCIAVDIRANNALERGELVQLAIENGVSAIGVYYWGVHMGWRGSKLKMWVK